MIPAPHGQHSRDRNVWRGSDQGLGPGVGEVCPKPQAKAGRGPWGSEHRGLEPASRRAGTSLYLHPPRLGIGQKRPAHTLGGRVPSLTSRAWAGLWTTAEGRGAHNQNENQTHHRKGQTPCSASLSKWDTLLPETGRGRGSPVSSPHSGSPCR